MKAKLKIIIPISAAVIAIIIAVLFINFSPKEKNDIESLMSSAQKYLIEHNYEQALAEFKKIIELDPNNADAYLGLANAYTGIGYNEGAVQILEDGYGLTGDKRLKKLLDEFLPVGTAESAVTTTGSEIVTTAAITSETTTETTTVSEEELITVPDLSGSTMEETAATETTAAVTAVTAVPVPTETTTAAKTSASEAKTTTTAKKEKSVKVQGYEIPTDIKKLALYGPDTSYISTDYLKNSGYVFYQLDKPLTDIDFVSQFTEIECLYLPNHNFSDISALSELTDLTDLDLSFNKISDISPLKGLTNLSWLELGGNKISDISVLKGLTNLKDLNLTYNNYSDSDFDELRKALPECTIYH